MEQRYQITGLDCANCAANLERQLKQISFFENVVIDFMAQRLILTAKDAEHMQQGLAEAERLIARVEPGVTISEKRKKKKSTGTAAENHIHGEHCGCGHDHAEHSHGGSCGCGHDHEAHIHEEHCGCGHDHKAQTHGEHCGCGHDHAEHSHGEHCGCGHDHAEHSHGEHCGCGHDHAEHSHGEHCGCGHDHAEHTHEEHRGCGHEHAEHTHGEHCGCGHDHAEHSHGEHCDCGHEHQKVAQAEHSHGNTAAGVSTGGAFTGEMKQQLAKIAAAAVLFLAARLAPVPDLVQVGGYLLAYLVVGGEIVLRAGKNIARGQVFDENFLMSVATIGAFAVGEYPEGVMVMLLYQLGELFQDYAVYRSRRSIADLMDIKPEVAHVKRGGSFVTVEPEEVAAGDIIQVRPGEKIPLDGVVLDGTSALNTVALTGESVPREVAPGQQVLSGCINTSGVLTVRVEKEYEDSTVAKILDLVENASSKKAETENFITRFARYYTPAVVGIAAVLAVIPPLVLQQPFGDWIYRALVFLVISCPCALVISIPLTFFGGLGACSSHGILVKGSNYLEALAQLETAVFDKTGTLTKGEFSVTEVHPQGCSQEQLLYYAACAESISNHPIAQALQKANRQPIAASALQHAEELAGYGIYAQVEGHQVLVGNHRLMEREQIVCQRAEKTGTIVYVAVDQHFMGWIVIADEIKPDAQQMVARLQELGVKEIVMLTGDNEKTAGNVAAQLGITKVYSQLLPGDKVTCMEKLLQQRRGKGTISFTGDGLNDAPVLARADVGIAMGGLGSDAAIEAADVVIMDDQPAKLADAIVLARKTRQIVQQNIVFILLVKALVLALGAAGLATMWMAVFADVGVAVLAILNAVRIIKA